MSGIEQIPIPQCVGNYDLGKTIGNGKFGKVKIGTHVLTGEKVAIKIVRKNRIDKDGVPLVYREINIMKLLKLLDHPNIIKLYEIVETESVVFMIMEYAAGGEILDYLITHGKLPEREARRFFAQVVSAMQYCHKLHVIHRDLKAENLLLDANCNIKIIDFGLSNAYVPGELMKTFCGSPTYAAPELIHRKNYVGPPVDVWSMGVLLYVLVCGKLPFEGADLRSLLLKSVNAEYTIPPHVSLECAEIIRSMLVVDPEERATLEEICRHNCLRGTSVYVPPPDADRELIIEKINAEQSSNRRNNTTINSKNMPLPALTEADLNFELVGELAGIFNVTTQHIMDEILNNTYGSISATYYLFLEKNSRKQLARLTNISAVDVGNTPGSNANKKTAPQTAEEPKPETGAGFKKGHRRTRTSDATITVNDNIQQQGNNIMNTNSQVHNIHTSSSQTQQQQQQPQSHYQPTTQAPSQGSRFHNGNGSSNTIQTSNHNENKLPMKSILSVSQKAPGGDPSRASVAEHLAPPGPTYLSVDRDGSPNTSSSSMGKGHKGHRRNVSVGVAVPAQQQGSQIKRPGFTLHKPFANAPTTPERTPSDNPRASFSPDTIAENVQNGQSGQNGQTGAGQVPTPPPPPGTPGAPGGPTGPLGPGGKPFKRGHYRHKSEGVALIQGEDGHKKSPVESIMSVLKIPFGNLWKHQNPPSPLNNTTSANPGNLTERSSRRDTMTESEEVRSSRFAFSASTTSTSSPSALISQVKKVLNECYITFVESENYCLECTNGDIVFEI